MQQIDELFQLIRSLSPSEKRYFKLQANKYESGTYKSQYEKLFDAINFWPEEDYDEALFKKRNKGKTFLKNLAYEKIYLRDLILKVMRSYHSERNIEIKVHEIILDLTFLTDKGLGALASKLYKQATNLAISAELLPEQLTLNQLQLRFKSKGLVKSMESAMAYEQKERSLLSNIQITRIAFHLLTRLYELQTTGKWKERTDEVETIYRRVLKLEQHIAITNRARMAFLNCKALYHFRKKNYQECYALCSMFVNDVETREDMKFLKTHSYYNTISNCLYAAMMLQKFDAFPNLLARLEDIEAHSEYENFEIFRTACNYKMVYALNTGNFNNSEALEKQTLAGLKQFNHLLTVTERTTNYLNLALLYFLQRKFERSLHFSKLLFSVADDKQTNFIIVCRFIEWISLFETDSVDELENKLRSLNRIIKEVGEPPLLKAGAEILKQQLKSIGLKAAKPKFPELPADGSIAPELEQVRGIITYWMEEQ
ncbi:MAG: hypothetical protein U0V74_01835 [Chitinophagales bacterium]